MEQRLDEEMRFHLEMLEEENVGRGLAPGEARRQFGGVTRTQEAWRDRLGFPLINDLFQDLRYAARGLRASMGFTAAVVLSFALGIAVNTLAYSVIERMWMVRLPYPQPERLVVIRASYPGDKYAWRRSSTPYRDVEDWSARNQSFRSLAAHTTARLSFRTASESARYLTIEKATASLFTVLGMGPELGRVFQAEECQPGRDDVVVLSHRLWTGSFGARQDVLGSRVWLDGRAMTVIGVMPAAFRSLLMESAPFLWIPLTSKEGAVSVIARLKADTELPQARAEMTLLAGHASGAQVEVSGMQAALGRALSSRELAWLLLAVELVFVIACANVASLLLARGNRRLAEVSLRQALGASRMRIVRQLGTESLLMSWIGCVAGVGLTYVWLQCLYASFPARSREYLAGFEVNYRVMAVSALVALAATVLAAVGPALAVSRRNLNAHLKEGHGSPGRKRRRFSRWLVGAEVALTLVLLTPAGVLGWQYSYWRNIEWTVPTEEIVVMTAEARGPLDGDSEKRSAFLTRLLETVRSRPGVRSAALTSSVRSPAATGAVGIEVTREGSPKRTVKADHRVVTPEYLATMSIPLRAGRFFTREDNQSSEKVTVISEAMSRRVWDSRSPIGQFVVIDGVRRSIVGVVGDIRRFPPDIPYAGEVLVPYLQASEVQMQLLVRPSGDPWALLAALGELAKAQDPDQPVERIATLERADAENNVGAWSLAVLFAIFAGGALLLSGVGIHGTVSYAVSERWQEIGIRRALGAGKARVVMEVLQGNMLPAALAIALGFWLGALGSGAFLLVNGVPPPLAWKWAFQAAGYTSGPVLLVALWACYGPARRAAAAEPMDVLRSE
jgi:putative ABC transport system permease protein